MLLTNRGQRFIISKIDQIDKVIAIINRKDDLEDKLVVCENGKNYTNNEIEKLIQFQEKYFKHKIIRKTQK